MSFDVSSGLSNLANKQHAIQRQQHNQAKVGSKSEGGKGMLSDGEVSELSNPTAEYFAALEDIKKKKRVHDSSVDDLMERLERTLVEKYDNSHNMLAEAFSGFKAGICQAVLTARGADFEEIQAIRKRAMRTAKKNVRLGFQRLAMAEAEFEVYVS